MMTNMAGSFETGVYPNFFEEIGVSAEQADTRLENDFQEIFFGTGRIYYENGDMGYLVDTGNNDVRTEGQSYGMMIAVQMNRRELFDRIWNWTKRYMWLQSGENAGYFGWSARLDGVLNSEGPAPDGEEYFAMALLFAARRWPDSALDYAAEARAILRAMVHNRYPMFDPTTKLIKFTPDSDFSDPSYHLPHFYEMFAKWGDANDAAFFREAAAASRAYLQKACHPETGLSAEYAEYDGTPKNVRNHHLFYSDAYRTAANIAMDALWFGGSQWHTSQADAIQRFFGENDRCGAVFHIDGTPAAPEELVVEADGRPLGVLHPLGLLATLAQSGIATRGERRRYFLQKLWDASPRTGCRRYYDNLLYLFALLSLSGHYRIYR